MSYCGGVSRAVAQASPRIATRVSSGFMVAALYGAPAPKSTGVEVPLTPCNT